MPISHFKITQASLITALTFIVGQIVAFVPAFGPDKQILISAGTALISATFLIANAIHAVVATKVSAKDLEGDVVSMAKTEVGKLNVNALVHDAISGQNIEQLVKNELNKVLIAAGLEAKRQETIAEAPAPVAPVVEVTPVQAPVSVPVVDPAAPAA